MKILIWNWQDRFSWTLIPAHMIQPFKSIPKSKAWTCSSWKCLVITFVVNWCYTKKSLSFCLHVLSVIKKTCLKINVISCFVVYVFGGSLHTVPHVISAQMKQQDEWWSSRCVVYWVLGLLQQLAYKASFTHCWITGITFQTLQWIFTIVFSRL